MPLSLAEAQAMYQMPSASAPGTYNSSFNISPQLLDFLKQARDAGFQNVMQLHTTPSAALNEQAREYNTPGAALLEQRRQYDTPGAALLEQRRQYDTPGAAQREAARQFDVQQRLQDKLLAQQIAQQNQDNYWRKYAAMTSPQLVQGMAARDSEDYFDRQRLSNWEAQRGAGVPGSLSNIRTPYWLFKRNETKG
jgi:hypothetical protein